LPSVEVAIDDALIGFWCSGKLCDSDPRRPQAARGKAPIKFRGPKPGETWSGRGLTPRRLTAYIKQGRKKERFASAKKK
jgi:DNA-binding protein H-NS